MNEKYLHFLWKSKRFLTTNLHTTSGEELQIRNFGSYNTDSGPDFFSGSIAVDNVTLHGNIEMHVNSSDWIRHGHQYDPAYNNVVLHVVFHHDMEIEVKGMTLPTLELKELIDWKHFEQVNGRLSFTQPIPCSSQLHEVPDTVIQQQLKRNTHLRLQRKATEIDEWCSGSTLSIHEVLFQSLAKAFGGKVNALPFLELATRIPLFPFLRASLTAKEAILFGIAGFLDSDPADEYMHYLQREWQFEQHRLQLSTMEVSGWKFKGTRPAAYPTVRLAQFAAFVHRMNWSEHFWNEAPETFSAQLTDVLRAPVNGYWNQHYRFGEKRAKNVDASLSKAGAEVILLNGLAPFLYWYGNRERMIRLLSIAIDLLECLPPEKNRIVERWEGLNFRVRNAREAQAVLELNNQFCARTQCLNCAIGKSILG